MRKHHSQNSVRSRPLGAAIIDAAGGVALFVLLFAVLHLPIMT